MFVSFWSLENLCFPFDDAKLRTFPEQRKYFYVFYSKKYVLLILVNLCSRTHTKNRTKRHKNHIFGPSWKRPFFIGLYWRFYATKRDNITLFYVIFKVLCILLLWNSQLLRIFANELNVTNPPNSVSIQTGQIAKLEKLCLQGHGNDEE